MASIRNRELISRSLRWTLPAVATILVAAATARPLSPQDTPTPNATTLQQDCDRLRDRIREIKQQTDRDHQQVRAADQQFGKKSPQAQEAREQLKRTRQQLREANREMSQLQRQERQTQRRDRRDMSDLLPDSGNVWREGPGSSRCGCGGGGRGPRP